MSEPKKAGAGKRRGAANTLDRVTFGKRLRAARKEYGWTLVQVAEMSGVSITTISRAERGLLALSYEKFSALGRTLHMDMGLLFSGDGVAATPFAEPVLTRAGEGVVYAGRSISYEFLSTTAVGKQMSPVLGTMLTRSIHGAEDFASHPGEEFVYVLSGVVDLHFDTGRVLRLEPGDSVYFDSQIGHAYVSVSRQLARVVGVTTNESRLEKLARKRKNGAPKARATARSGTRP